MKLILMGVKDEAPGTKSFFWKPESHVDFLPGQYLYYTLPKLNYPDERGETRHFTISSSPTEGDLRLTTRIRQESGYKKTLDELPIGAVVEGRGPQGTFVLPDQPINPSTVQLFVAGGIGITPFRSMIKYLYDKNQLKNSYLIYSNSDENFVFGSELKSWLGDKVEFINTSVSGHIDKLKIIKLLDIWHLKLDIPTFWLVGPPKFVSSMEETLAGLQIPQDRVVSEKFTGY